MKEISRVENDGICDKGWQIFHERAVVRNVALYGQGRFRNWPGSLFEWCDESREYSIKPKLGMTHVTPGSLEVMLRDFAKVSSQIRRVHEFIDDDKYDKQKFISRLFFTRRLEVMFDSRIGVYFRRVLIGKVLTSY